VALHTDAGYFAADLAAVTYFAGIDFVIGVKRIALLWRMLAGITERDWVDATCMSGAQVAVADYRPAWWPAHTRLLECASLKWPHLEPE